MNFSIKLSKSKNEIITRCSTHKLVNKRFLKKQKINFLACINDSTNIEFVNLKGEFNIILIISPNF